MSHSLHRLPLALALLALLLAPLQPAAAQAPLPAAASVPAASAAGGLIPPRQAALPRFEPTDCWFDLPADEIAGETLVCGWLVVPEEHGVPGTLEIKLAVVLLRSLTFDPPPEPVVFVPGQPGQGAIAARISSFFSHPLRDLRNLIVYDPRGAGYSQPALNCPEVQQAVLAQYADPVDPATAGQNYNAAALVCRERLVQGGVNLSAYNTLEAAADLDDLRRALGYSQLNLYAPGYGARVVLNTVRNYAGGVRGVVLDGPLTPQSNLLTEAPAAASFALNEFFAACAAITRCNVWHRQLERELVNTIDRLNSRPASLTLVDPHTGAVHPLRLTGDALVGYLLQLIARTDALPLLPELFQRFAAGQYGPLETFISSVAFDPGFAAGAYWSAVCAEDGSAQLGPPDVSQLRRQVQYQAAHIQSAFELCQSWRVRSILPAAAQPVISSTVPGLVLNGNFDPYTQRLNGDLAALAFNRPANVVFINAGHGVYPAAGDCATELVEDFWETPGLVLDTDCVAETPELFFVIPPDVVEMPVRALLNDLRAQRTQTILWLAFLSLATLVLLSTLIVFPLAAWFGKKDEGLEMPAFPTEIPTEIPTGLPPMPPPPDFSQAGSILPKAAPWLAVLFGLGVLALGVAFPLLVVPVLDAGAPITWIGLPGSLTWYAIVPVALLVLALLLVITTFALWFNKDTSRGRKLYHALLLPAALLALGLLIGAGALLPAWRFVVTSFTSTLGR